MRCVCVWGGGLANVIYVLMFKIVSQDFIGKIIHLLLSYFQMRLHCGCKNVL